MIVQSPNFTRKPSPLKIEAPAWNEDVLIPKPVILTSPLKSKTSSNLWSREGVSSARKNLFGNKSSTNTKSIYQTNTTPLSPSSATSFNKVFAQQARAVPSASSSPITPVNNISSPRSSNLEFEAGLEIQHILQGSGIEEKAPAQAGEGAPSKQAPVEQRVTRTSPSALQASNVATSVTNSVAAAVNNDEMFELDATTYESDDDNLFASSAERVIVITAQHNQGASIVRTSAGNYGHGSLWSLDDDDDMNLPRYQHRNYAVAPPNTSSLDHNLHHHEHLLAIANIQEMTPPVRADNPIYMDSRFYNDMHCAMSPSEQHDGAELGIFNFSPPRLCSSH